MIVIWNLYLLNQTDFVLPIFFLYILIYPIKLLKPDHRSAGATVLKF